jgi:hypothetical protein
MGARRQKTSLLRWCAILPSLFSGVAVASPAGSLPAQPAPFKGRIGTTVDQSNPLLRRASWLRLERPTYCSS